MKKKQILAVSVILVLLTAVVVAIISLGGDRKTSSLSLQVAASSPVSQTIEVPLRISVTQPINAGEFYFSFPTNLLEVKEIKTSDSFMTLWIKDSPSFSNDAGTIYIAGGLPSPGFSGQDGLVATVVFTTKAKGTGQISLESKSRTLLNDGKGTELPFSYQPVHFSIR